MPIYEYRCEHGHTFEVMQRMTDDPVSVCSTCDAPVERVFHPVAVHFKGSGFYTTDYGRKRAGEAKENGEAGDKKQESSSSGVAKSESGAAKSEAGASKSESGASKSESGASKSD